MEKGEYVVRHGIRWMVVRVNEDGNESVYEVTNSEENARKIADAENRHLAALKRDEG